MTKSGNQSIFAVALFAAAHAGHWFITPIRHPNPTPLEYWGTVVELVGGLAVAIWAWRRSRRAASRATSLAE